jgi:hypothetical protein
VDEAVDHGRGDELVGAALATREPGLLQMTIGDARVDQREHQAGGLRVERDVAVAASGAPPSAPG